MNEEIKKEKGKIDWGITLIPLGIIIALCILFLYFRKVPIRYSQK